MIEYLEPVVGIVIGALSGLAVGYAAGCNRKAGVRQHQYDTYSRQCKGCGRTEEFNGSHMNENCNRRLTDGKT